MWPRDLRRPAGPVAQETVPGALVHVGEVGFVQITHTGAGRLHRGRDECIVAAVEPENGAVDSGQFFLRVGRRSVTDDGGVESGLLGRIDETGAAPPAKPDASAAVRRRGKRQCV